MAKHQIGEKGVYTTWQNIASDKRPFRDFKNLTSAENYIVELLNKSGIAWRRGEYSTNTDSVFEYTPPNASGACIVYARVHHHYFRWVNP